jgi:hypothetical protein
LSDAVPLDELSPSVLYDVFQDTANALTGQYLQRERDASDAQAAATWWAKVLELRDEARTQDPDDRASLIECATRWRREAAELHQ